MLQEMVRSKGAALTRTTGPSSPGGVASARFVSSPTAIPRVDQPQRLVIFTRYPESGATKTRMIPALGAAGAAALQRRMTQHTLRWADQVRRDGRVALEVRFQGGDAARMAAQFGSEFAYRRQPAGDLGQRMAQTFTEAFAAGARRVVIVGTDCPELSVQEVEAAFAALDDHDVVFGPAIDGGYYLIGLRRSAPELFAGVAWGGDAVLSTSVRTAARLRLSVGLLKSLADVDRPEDLRVWERAAARERRSAGASSSLTGEGRGEGSQRISIVIPTFNEAEYLPGTLAHVMYAVNTEVIVVDGGSIDDTRAIARACGAKVLRCDPGRGRQMNAGAAAAQGELVLFLHADTRLAVGFDAAVRDVLSDATNVAGAFSLRIDGCERGLRVVERLVQLRSRRLHLPYGDQALFMRTETFRQMGGYAALPIMEDVQLIRRLRRRGRIAILNLGARTSARRWQRLGVWRATLRNQVCLGAYCLGVPPARIAKWYGGGGRTQ